VITHLVASMVSAATSGMTGRNTWAIGKKTRYLASAFTHGSMAVATKASGTKTIWKEWASIFGTMVVCTKVNIRTIKNMALEYTHGRIVDATKGIGTKVNSTESEPMLCLRTTKRSTGFGKTERELNGSTKFR